MTQRESAPAQLGHRQAWKMLHALHENCFLFCCMKDCLTTKSPCCALCYYKKLHSKKRQSTIYRLGTSCRGEAMPCSMHRKRKWRERQNRGRGRGEGPAVRPRPAASGDRSAGIQFANGVNCTLCALLCNRIWVTEI